MAYRIDSAFELHDAPGATPAGLSCVAFSAWISGRRAPGGNWRVTGIAPEHLYSGDASVVGSAPFLAALGAFLSDPRTPLHQTLFLQDCEPDDFSTETDPTLTVFFQSPPPGG